MTILNEDAVWFRIFPLLMHDLCDSTPIIEAVDFIEKSVHIYRTTRGHIPEDGYLLTHRSDKLVSHHVIKLGHNVNRKLFFGPCI
jgi:hypothetical protein